jgi:hypothetical protein
MQAEKSRIYKIKNVFKKVLTAKRKNEIIFTGLKLHKKPAGSKKFCGFFIFGIREL